ncbi:MAG: hypothetical protein WCZ28_08270 [Burkholderiaceae bacterium]
MSRYAITISSPARTDDNATIGYDPPLRTYFLQAFFDSETDWPDLALGERLEQLPTLPMLLEALDREGYAITEGLTPEVVAAMAEEAARPPRRSVAERYGLLVMLDQS